MPGVFAEIGFHVLKFYMFVWKLIVYSRNRCCQFCGQIEIQKMTWSKVQQ